MALILSVLSTWCYTCKFLIGDLLKYDLDSVVDRLEPLVCMKRLINPADD